MADSEDEPRIRISMNAQEDADRPITQPSEPKIFKLCKVKDRWVSLDNHGSPFEKTHNDPTSFCACACKQIRFSQEQELGYRYICLNLEVGWTTESESKDDLEFVPARDFGAGHVRTHICEVRILQDGIIV